jgi:hypothetical protein
MAKQSDQPARPYELQQIPPRRDPITDRPIPRYHKACVLDGGRRMPRTKRQMKVWHCMVMLAYRLGKLTETRLRVILALPEWLNWKTGRCDPAHATIAEKVGCKPRTVQRALADARRLDLIDWDQRAVTFKPIDRPKDTVQITNQYQVFPGLAADAEAPAIDTPPCHEQSVSKKERVSYDTRCSDSPSLVDRALASMAARSGLTLKARPA